MNLWTVLLGRRLAPRPVYQFVTEYRTVMGPPDLVLYSPAGLVLRLKRDFWIAPGLQWDCELRSVGAVLFLAGLGLHRELQWKGLMECDDGLA